RLRERPDDGAQRVLQAAVLRLGRVRRGAGPPRHRRHRGRADRVLDGFPARRFEVSPGRRVVSQAADLRGKQAQDPLGQLRRVLRASVLMGGPSGGPTCGDEEAAMTAYKLISADSHIVEPPDLYAKRIEPRFRDRAPRLERLETPTGRKFDAWVIDGQQVGTLGAVMQAGQRFEDPSQIDFLGMWEDVRLGAYDPHSMIKENEMDGVWGSCLQPSQGLFWSASRTARCSPPSAASTTTGSRTSASPIPTVSRASPCSTWTMSRRPRRSS